MANPTAPVPERAELAKGTGIIKMAKLIGVGGGNAEVEVGNGAHGRPVDDGGHGRPMARIEPYEPIILTGISRGSGPGGS